MTNENEPADPAGSESFGGEFVNRTFVTVLYLAGWVFVVSMVLLCLLALLNRD